MKIVIPGGSGHIGRILQRAWSAAGHEIVVLTRSPRANPLAREVGWDGRTPGPWTDEICGADVVVNLAGRSVNCRYHAANLAEMMASRVDSTLAVGAAIAGAARPPPVWLQMSTATIYAHRFDAPNDEAAGLIGGAEPDVPRYWDASIAIARAWEACLESTNTPGTRRVALRTAMVMSPEPGGAFATMATLARRGLGGAQGSGRQFVSWIHEADFVAALDFLIADPRISGPVNVCSPGPLPNREFQAGLRRTLGVRLHFPMAGWMMELGAMMLRTETELVMKSRRVVPGRLISAGFRFRYERWREAVAELAPRWQIAA